MSVDAEVMFWEPMWGNQRKKAVDKEREIKVLLELLELAGVKPNDADLTLDYHGNKTLRIKLFKGAESSIKLYDYRFYGPLVFSEGKIYIRETAAIMEEADHGNGMVRKITSIMLPIDKIVAKIKEDKAQIMLERKKASEELAKAI